jgi:hypothetical protein
MRSDSDIEIFNEHLNEYLDSIEESYSLERLRTEYPIDWEFCNSLDLYPLNYSIFILCGVDPQKKEDINETICTNIKYCDELCREKEQLVLKITYGKPCQYQPNEEEKKNFERFKTVKSNFNSCIINKNKFIEDVDFLKLLSLKDIQKDLNYYYKKDDPIKKNEFKKIVVELKKLYPIKYAHIPESFLTNSSSKSNKDCIIAAVTLIKQKADDLNIKLVISECIELVAYALNIQIVVSGGLTCYNKVGKTIHGFGYKSVHAIAQKEGSFESRPQGRLSKTAENERKTKLNEFKPFLESGVFNQLRDCCQKIADKA